MTVVHLDYETFSCVELKGSGAYKYAESNTTEILCTCYAFDDGPVHLWIPAVVEHALIEQLRVRDMKLGMIHNGGSCPVDLKNHIESGGEVRAHNAGFERIITNSLPGQKTGIPRLEWPNLRCTAAKAAAAGVPRSLGDACAALGTYPKDDGGRISMLQVVKPKKPTKKDPSDRYTPDNAPDKFIDLWAYCADDVRAERDLDHALPDLSPSEQKVWELDGQINDRGVLVDLEAIANVQVLIAEYKAHLEAEMEKATREDDGLGTITPGLKPTQREKIADWIRANGWPNLLDMQAETVKDLVSRDEVPSNVKHVLRIYSTFGAKAISKFETMVEAACADGRVRGMFMFHGAQTGRWSSTIIQLQNLFRGVIDDPSTAIAAFRSRNLKFIQALYPEHDFMKVAASTVRGHIVATKNKKFVCLDYAGVESRANAYLWGEQWKLDAFKEFDAGRGPDLYRIAFANVFNVDPCSVNKKDRQAGKVIDLFGQYGGGTGAFVNLAGQYAVDLDELAEKIWPVLKEDVIDSAEWMWNKFGKQTELSQRVFMACDGAKQLWRRSHPGTVSGWKELETAAELAVQFPGQAYPVAAGKGMFKVVRGPRGHEWLCLLLPSRKRMLRYFKPEWTPPKKVVTIEPVVDFDGVTREKEVERETPGELHYMGVDTNTRRYMRTSSYGGSWNNNFVQGFCADLLRNGMFELEGGGYPIVLTVHDENGAEVDEAFGSVEEATALMCTPKEWFAGLPLVAEGWSGSRYRK